MQWRPNVAHRTPIEQPHSYRVDSMTSSRKRRVHIVAALLERNACCAHEDRVWDEMSPIGHEIGSPDFERLM